MELQLTDHIYGGRVIRCMDRGSYVSKKVNLIAAVRGRVISMGSLKKRFFIKLQHFCIDIYELRILPCGSSHVIVYT